MKPRWRKHMIDNLGAFGIAGADRNAMFAGEWCDISAEGVIDFCRENADS